MSTDERLLRLENAFATLAELAAQSAVRADATDQRVDILTELMARSLRRTDTLAELVRATSAGLEMLTKLAQSMDERVVTQMDWLNELGAAQANAEARIAALADAQIRTDERIRSIESNLDALSQIAVEIAQAQARTVAQVARHEERLDELQQ